MWRNWATLFASVSDAEKKQPLGADSRYALLHISRVVLFTSRMTETPSARLRLHSQFARGLLGSSRIPLAHLSDTQTMWVVVWGLWKACCLTLTTPPLMLFRCDVLCEEIRNRCVQREMTQAKLFCFALGHSCSSLLAWASDRLKGCCPAPK